MTNEERQQWTAKIDKAFQDLNAVIEAAMDADFLIEIATAYKEHKSGALLYSFGWRWFDKEARKDEPCECPRCKLKRFFAQYAEAGGNVIEIGGEEESGSVH